MMQEKEDLFRDIVSDILKDGDVSDARMVYYDTKVYSRGDYDEYLAGAAKSGGSEARAGQPGGSTVAQPDRSRAQRERLSRAVSDRLGKNVREGKTSTVKRGQAPAMGAE
jgi:hypothetical protein